MKTCGHCGYSAPGTWSTCPSCGQLVGDSAVSSTGPGPGPDPGPGAAPGGYPPAPRPTGPSPANPYAAPHAGYSQPMAYYPQPYGPTLPTSGKAIASMVLGILSIALIYFGVILGPLAIGFYSSARSDLRREPPEYKGHGINIAGLVTGIIGTLIGLLMVAAISAIVCAADRSSRPM